MEDDSANIQRAFSDCRVATANFPNFVLGVAWGVAWAVAWAVAWDLQGLACEGAGRGNNDMAWPRFGVPNPLHMYESAESLHRLDPDVTGPPLVSSSLADIQRAKGLGLGPSVSVSYVITQVQICCLILYYLIDM
jgi:hypothetical protein